MCGTRQSVSDPTYMPGTPYTCSTHTHTHTHKPKILAQQQKLLIDDSKAKKKIETNQPILPKTNNLAL